MADNIGVDAARVNGGDANALRLHFVTQCFAKAQNAEFGGVIGALCRHADKPENGRYIGDMAAAARDHGRQKGLCAMHDAPKINIHDPLEIIHGHLGHRRAMRHAGIVQHKVSRAMRFFDFCRQCKHGVAIGDIQLMRLHASAGLFDLFGDRLQHIHAQIGADDNRAFRRHGARAGRTNAAAGTGDDTDFIFEMTHETLPDCEHSDGAVSKRQKKSPVWGLFNRNCVVALADFFLAAAFQRLIGLRRMGGAIRAARFGPRAAEMKFRRTRVTDRPFACMLGEVQDAGAFLGAQNRLRHHLILDIVQIRAAETAIAGKRRRGRPRTSGTGGNTRR